MVCDGPINIHPLWRPLTPPSMDSSALALCLIPSKGLLLWLAGMVVVDVNTFINSCNLETCG